MADRDQELIDINEDDEDVFPNNSDDLEPDVVPDAPASPEPESTSATQQTYSAVIHCIFSARFDESQGPIIEWQFPPAESGMALTNVEFNVLASGLHNKAGPDIIYFKHEKYFGIGCYKRHLKNNRNSRDAVMRSVGVIMEHYGFLYKHTPFLIRTTTDQITADLTDQAKADMVAYYKKHQANTLDVVHAPSPSLSFNLPTDAFSDLFSLLGDRIFTLWKAVLLRKKILFILEPPLRLLCMNVYAAIFLARHQVKAAQRRILEPSPLFYVNITETRAIMTQSNYLACTTERIFEGKTHMYDVLVASELNSDRPTDETTQISAHDADLRAAIQQTVGDKLKHMFLLKRYQAQDQNMLLSFFQDMNNKLLNGILTARHKRQVIGPEEMPQFGLHSSDFRFFMALLDFLGVDLPLKLPMCNCCL